MNILTEKNCVFVDFYDEKAATDAFAAMQGMTMDGNIVELGFGKCEERALVGPERRCEVDAEPGGAADVPGGRQRHHPVHLHL